METGFPSIINENYFFTYTQIKAKVIYSRLVFFISAILVSTLEVGTTDGDDYMIDLASHFSICVTHVIELTLNTCTDRDLETLIRG